MKQVEGREIFPVDNEWIYVRCRLAAAFGGLRQSSEEEAWDEMEAMLADDAGRWEVIESTRTSQGRSFVAEQSDEIGRRI
jgi:hypothetical protein